MKMCQDCAGFVAMAGFGGMIAGIVVSAILRNAGFLRDPEG